METESGEVTAGAREGGLRGTVSAGEIKDFWRRVAVMVAQQYECTCSLKMVKTVNSVLCAFCHN